MKKRAKKPTRWCFYELNKKGSCEFGDNCNFSHNVPKNGPEILRNWCSNHIKHCTSNNVPLTVKGNSKIHHFLVNIMKEMISKEKTKKHDGKANELEEDPANQRLKTLPYMPLI